MIDNKNTPPSRPITRNSSIELLKIVAILSIIASHCTQSLAFASPYYQGTDYLLDLGSSTVSPQHFFLTLLMYAGLFGNAIFVVSSFYFLQDSIKASKFKIFRFALDIWMISILFSIGTLIIRKGDISFGLLIRQLFPNYFCNNWFMTLWMIMYLLHPILNAIIELLGKQWLLRTCLVLFFFYSILATLRPSNLFSSLIIVWISFYLIIAFVKRYLNSFCNEIKWNILLAFAPLLFHCFILLFINLLASHTGILENKLLRFRFDCNPLFFLSAIGLFNLFKHFSFSNRVVNSISACSMLLYVIHENQLLRYYFRPKWWDYIYNTVGYEYVFFLDLGMALALFATSLIICLMYKATIQKITIYAGEKIYNTFSKIWNDIEQKLLRVSLKYC
jgi:surface polysaccharide O-acyltransferase-like enzyme